MSVSDSLRELPASVFQNVFCVSRPSVLARSGDCVRFWVAGFASADMPPYKRRFLIRFSHTTLCRCVVFPPACDEGLLWNSCPFVFFFCILFVYQCVAHFVRRVVFDVGDINGLLGKRLPVQPLQSKMWKNTGQIWIIAICECKTV